MPSNTESVDTWTRKEEFSRAYLARYSTAVEFRSLARCGVTSHLSTSVSAELLTITSGSVCEIVLRTEASSVISSGTGVPRKGRCSL